MSRRPLTFFLATAAALGGCTVGPDYAPRTATELGLPEGYSVPSRATREDMVQWWNRFDDPLLQRLVASAADTNLDVAQSVTRLRQARESLRQSRASLLPSVGGSAGYSRGIDILGGGGGTTTLPNGTVISTGRTARDNFTLGVDASYQVGLFGEIRRSIEASDAQYQASGYDSAAIAISVQAEVARNYIVARLAQANLANARSSLTLQDDNLEIAGFRVQAGLVSSLDQEQARLQRAQTAASIPSIELSYNQAVSRLGVLTGQAPGALKAEMAAARRIPRGPSSVGVGIPADVLRQRPDVLAAERNLVAATANIGVAKSQLYPALALSGSIDTNGGAIDALGDIVTGRFFAGLTQLIFDGGRARAQVRANEAAAEGALLAYRGTILTALEDVENAVVALATAQARAREFTVALDAAQTTALLSRSQYRAGLTDFTTLNQAEGGLLSARNGLAQAQSDQATALVQLYLALGGGWDSTTIPQAPSVSPPFPQASSPPPTQQDR